MPITRTATLDLHLLARITNLLLPAAFVVTLLAGLLISFYFHFLTVALLMLNLLNVAYLFVQRRHTLLRNFGILGQARYFMESIGPELRQYFFANDTEERPFNRAERAEVYRKSRGIDSTGAFGSLNEYDGTEIKLRHSIFPTPHDQLLPYELKVGAARGLETAYTLHHPIMISAMSYGALSAAAVEALSRGAKAAGILMNTGEGGFPKYHLLGGADITFQLGTAKFGVRHPDGRLDDEAFAKLCARPEIKMVEIKFSQGAKPGKGGLLPKEKISEEIAELRGVGRDKDVISPSGHAECHDLPSTVAFIRHVQTVGGLPTGFKLCLGSPQEFEALVQEMIKQDTFPDFITVDGAEGGTGAAPTAFLDGVGMPLFVALRTIDSILIREKVRDRLVLFASGKLINPAKQLLALCLGADACYSARGFMLALGCIQALQCNRNTCPVGITTHDPSLIRGFVVEEKAKRVQNYVEGLQHDFDHLIAAAGVRCASDLTLDHLYIPHQHELAPLMNPETSTAEIN